MHTPSTIRQTTAGMLKQGVLQVTVLLAYWERKYCQLQQDAAGAAGCALLALAFLNIRARLWCQGKHWPAVWQPAACKVDESANPAIFV